MGTLKTRQAKEAFCVIGPKVGRYSNSKRRWFTTDGDASDHARELLKGRPPGSDPAIVVKAVRVFEVEPHPIVERNVSASDAQSWTDGSEFGDNN